MRLIASFADLLGKTFSYSRFFMGTVHGCLVIFPQAIVPVRRPRRSRSCGRLTGHKFDVGCVAFHPDGKTLASASEDGTVMLWDVTSRKRLTILSGHTGLVFCVAWSPDGKALASASADKTIKLWDIDKKKTK